MTTTAAEGLGADATPQDGHGTARPRAKPRGMVTLALGGVALPLLTLGFELATGMCADMLFDPIPTWAHVAAVALVPVLNFVVLAGMHRGRVLGRAHGAGFGVAYGVSIYYALLFLPLVPAAVIGILFMGLGLLALSPQLATLAGIGIWRRLRARGVALRPILVGVGAGLMLPLLAEAVPLANDVLLSAAASDDADERTRAVERLRRFGSHDHLLQACYRPRGSAAGIAGFVHRQLSEMPTTQQARQIYFRVYGRSYTSEPRPPEVGLWGGRERGRFIADPSERDVRLRSSRLDGSVDAEASVGYLEWTLVFENTAAFGQAEARAELALPTGGSVSRATLWVDGEPREAAFAATSKVKAAYQQVVQRRRDPLLVTQTAPERVRVQCFPVPAGGTMKIRVGITFPLLPDAEHESAYALPYLVDHNFAIADDLRHAVWIESGAPIRSDHGAAGKRFVEALATPALRTTLLHAPWRGPRTSLALDGEHATVQQRYERRTRAAPRHVVVVVDASTSLAPHAAALRRVLEARLRETPTTLVFATDGAPSVHELPGGVVSGASASAFDAVELRGGRDNTAALRRAIALATQHGAAEVLWLHGPQAELLGDVEQLSQAIERSEHAPSLVPFAIEPGAEALLGELAASSAIVPPVRRGDALRELDYHLQGYGSERWVPVRWRQELPAASSSEDAGATPPRLEPDTGRHLVRLWAAQHVASGCEGLATQDCTALASHYQLVSHLSGAVVLESQAQYVQAGLTPVDPATVPSVPEPEEWLLMLTLALAALARGSRRRRGWQVAP